MRPAITAANEPVDQTTLGEPLGGAVGGNGRWVAVGTTGGAIPALCSSFERGERHHVAHGRRLTVACCTVILLTAIVLSYRPLFSSGATFYADWPYIYRTRLLELSQRPVLWDASLNLGFPRLEMANLTPLYFAQGLLARNFGWGFDHTEKLLWYVPILLGMILGPSSLIASLGGQVGRQKIVAAAFATATYSLNSYIFVLMAEAGHMNIAGAYAVAPFSLAAFILLWRRMTTARIAFLAFALALEFAYDARITPTTMLVGLGWCLTQPSTDVARRSRLRSALGVGLGLLCFAALQAYWLVPILTANAEPAVPKGYDSGFWLRALSFQRLPHVLALFHSFWGDPITYFSPHPVAPLFFVLPVVSFGGLLLPDEPQYPDRRLRLFFAGTSLLFAFAAKGSNPPFGAANEWVFLHIPVASLFRESSKYLPAFILGFAPLFGMSVAGATECLTRHDHWRSQRVAQVLPVGAALLICFLMIPALRERLGGNFVPRSVAPSHELLNEMLARDPSYGRVLWFPGLVPDAPAWSLHPAADGSQIFDGAKSDDPNWGFGFIRSPGFEDQIRRMQVKYIVVPDIDEAASIYRWFPASRGRLMADLDHLTTFARQDMGRAAVYVATGWQDDRSGARMYLTSDVGAVSAATALYEGRYEAADGRPRDMLITSDASTAALADVTSGARENVVLQVVSASDTRYESVVHGDTAGVFLVLREAYSPQWEVVINGWHVEGARHVLVNGYANGWYLPWAGDGDRIIVEFAPQNGLARGYILTAAVAVGLIAAVVYSGIMDRLMHPTFGRREHGP